MIRYLDLGATPGECKAKIGPLIRSGEIKLGGYQKGKIYGTLTCSAGKRMKAENRVFFGNEKEALSLGYRPCSQRSVENQPVVVDSKPATKLVS